MDGAWHQSLFWIAWNAPIFCPDLAIGEGTFGLFLKTIISLLNTLFLSIATALLFSSFSQDERRSLMASLAVVGTLILGPAVVVEFLVGLGWNAVFAWGIIRRCVLSRFERTVAEGAMGASKASNTH